MEAHGEIILNGKRDFIFLIPTNLNLSQCSNK